MVKEYALKYQIMLHTWNECSFMCQLKEHPIWKKIVLLF